MTNRNTRRAFLASLMALILCVSSLLGTTYAWFTDEVTSNNNIIKSGNLDIELEYWDGTKWEDVNGADDILTNTLWEPGVTEVAYLRVANAGTLAFKYQLGINVVSETEGVNKAGASFKLSDYIQFGVVEGVNVETNAYANREAAVNAVTDAKIISKGYTKASSLLPEKELYLALVVWMPTDVGNVANHNGTNVPQINLGFNVFATQLEYEEDSFGKDFDNGAPIITVPETLPGAGEALVISGSAESKVTVSIPAAVISTLDNEVTAISVAASAPVVDTSNKTVSFSTVELVDQNGEEIDISNASAKVTITLPVGNAFNEGETVVIYHDDEYMATAIVTDGFISYQADHFCEVTVGTVQAPTVEGNTVKIANAAQLFGFAQDVNSGKDYYEGKTVVLTADIDLKNAEWTPIGSATADHGFMGNFDGNGYKIKNLSITNIAVDTDNCAYAGFFGVTEGAAGAENVIENLVIENVTINTKGDIVAAAIAYPYYTTLKNITVCGDIAIEGGNYTSGVLAYTRRCTTASNISVSGKEGSYITGAITVGGVISDIQTNGGIVANYSNFSASGITVTGNKAVGGISGIIGGQTLNGAKVENVELVCSNAHVGIVAGSYDGKPVINNATYSKVTGTAAIVGAPYGESSNRNVIIDGEEFVGVKNGDELKAALADNMSVILLDNILMEATESNGYGKTGINVKNGQTIDGNGYLFRVYNAGGTWGSAISTTGGIIKNITIGMGFRGIFVNHNSTYSEKVVLDNVTIHGSTYTISCDQGLNQGIEATNCTFDGWTSFAKTAGEAKFVNCSFGEYGGNAFCRPYSDTEFVNCTFSEGYAVDMTKATITFTDCKNPNA